MTTHAMSCDFPVGSLVVVESRTWRGINKPGGAGKVTKSYVDDDGVPRVDVKYVLSGTEKSIELEWVKIQQFLGRSKRSRKKDETFVQEQSKTLKKAIVKRKVVKIDTPAPVKKRRVVKNNNNNTARPNVKKIDSEALVKIADPEIVLIPGPAQAEEDDRILDAKFDTSIPREITIVSCCTSTGSLSFQENLANANKTYFNSSTSSNRGRKNKKIMELQAKSNRKMTEFFTSSTSQPPNRKNATKKTNEFSIHNDVTTPTIHNTNTSTNNDDNPDYDTSNVTSSTPKASAATSTINRQNNIKKVSIATKTSAKPTTRRPLLPHNKNTSLATTTSGRGIKKTKQNDKTTAEKSSSAAVVVTTTSSAMERKNKPPSLKPEEPLVDEQRFTIFMAIFSDLIREMDLCEIQLSELILQINQRMIVNSKFEDSEVLAYVKQLDKNMKIMYSETSNDIYII